MILLFFLLRCHFVPEAKRRRWPAHTEEGVQTLIVYTEESKALSTQVEGDFVFYDNDINAATYFPTYCVPLLLLHTHSYLRSKRGRAFLRTLSNGIVSAQLRAILPPGDIRQGLETILIVTTRMGGRLASSGQSPGLLLNTLQSWGRPHNRGKSAQSVSRGEAEKPCLGEERFSPGELPLRG